MTYPPGVLDTLAATGDFAAVQAIIPDGWAYGVFTSDTPVLHAYHLDPDVVAVSAQLAAHGTLSLVDRFRMVVLAGLLRSTARVPGEVWELGVYRGGTAALMRNILAAEPAPPMLRLFDTFAGMPATDPAHDLHAQGDFADVSLDAVRALVGADSFIDYRAGLVPATFRGTEHATLRFCHVDLDIYAPIAAALEFIYPRLSAGGVLLCDDYGFATCPGARSAVDVYCKANNIPSVVLPTGQALLLRM